MPQRMDVLRWGYRLGRDPRITTHLGLVARALGATGFLLTGDRDEDLFDNLQSVCQRFGGELETTHVPGLKHLKNHVQNGGVAVHLTMYGESYHDAIEKIPRDKDILIVVGGAKVPAEVFKTCQFNVAVGNQPHSEVAALALFMDAWQGHRSTLREFPNAELSIQGTNDGKIVVENDAGKSIEDD